ncbi:MAG: OmpA family protein, partial [Pseudomonadota bacterium]
AEAVAEALAGLQARLLFAEGSAELSAAALSQIDRVAEAIGPNGPAVTVQGFAGGEDPNVARRLALSRATVTRQQLGERGLNLARMNILVPAEGREAGPADRVDILVNP